LGDGGGHVESVLSVKLLVYSQKKKKKKTHLGRLELLHLSRLLITITSPSTPVVSFCTVETLKQSLIKQITEKIFKKDLT
jgi:hypothetical protein